MNRAWTLLAIVAVAPLWVIFETGCGGCYAHAKDVRLEGSSCVTAAPSSEAGCGEAIILVDNACAEPAVFNGVGRSVTVAPGAKDVEVTTNLGTTEGGRGSVRGTVGNAPITLSWRTGD